MTDFPSQIYGYTLRRHIASGGMADVFEATHPTTNRRVALKLMKEELRSKPTAQARFSREVRTIAMLSHSNIVSIIDAGEAAAGHPFLVTDYVDGPCLRQVIEQHRVLTPHRACIIALQLARALSYSHGAGVIHRDLKPENILLESCCDKIDHVVLIDFGVSRVLIDDSMDGDLTSSGGVLGTPNYMSPEQARGDVALRPATDCYALGALMYEMLSGERAHQGDTRQAVLHHVMYHRVKPLPSDSLLSFPELGSLVARCLDKRPERRPRASEIVQILEQSLNKSNQAGYHSSMDTLATAPNLIRFKQGVARYAAIAILAASCGWSLSTASTNPVPPLAGKPDRAAESEAAFPPTLRDDYLANRDRAKVSDEGKATWDTSSNGHSMLAVQLLQHDESGAAQPHADAPRLRALQAPAPQPRRNERKTVVPPNSPQHRAFEASVEPTPKETLTGAHRPPEVLVRPLLQNPYASQNERGADL